MRLEAASFDIENLDEEPERGDVPQEAGQQQQREKNGEDAPLGLTNTRARQEKPTHGRTVPLTLVGLCAVLATAFAPSVRAPDQTN